MSADAFVLVGFELSWILIWELNGQREAESEVFLYLSKGDSSIAQLWKGFVLALRASQRKQVGYPKHIKRRGGGLNIMTM